MHRLGGILLLACVLVGGFASQAASVPTWFSIRPTTPPYRSVSADSFSVQFEMEIHSPVSGDQLYVEYTPHVPDGWFSQYCQVSTGICYFGSHAITLPADGNELLQIDFFTNVGMLEMGWVDVRIYRVSDPGTFQEITFALGHGVTLPTPRFYFRSENVFAQAEPNDTVGFSSVIRSLSSLDDSLIVRVRSDLPDGWFAQFCQVSTGVCYFGDATIPFPGNTLDSLAVDFFCFNPDPAIGNYRLRVQSRANPAFWTAIPFRVRTGDIPADAEEATSAAQFSASISPNPLRGSGEIRINLTRPAAVRWSLLDISGRVVSRSETPMLQPGVHRLGMEGTDGNGRPLPSGVYFYRVEGAGEGASGKLTIGR